MNVRITSTRNGRPSARPNLEISHARDNLGHRIEKGNILAYRTSDDYGKPFRYIEVEAIYASDTKGKLLSYFYVLMDRLGNAFTFDANDALVPFSRFGWGYGNLTLLEADLSTRPTVEEALKKSSDPYVLGLDLYLIIDPVVLGVPINPSDGSVDGKKVRISNQKTIFLDKDKTSFLTLGVSPANRGFDILFEG